MSFLILSYYRVLSFSLSLSLSLNFFSRVPSPAQMLPFLVVIDLFIFITAITDLNRREVSLLWAFLEYSWFKMIVPWHSRVRKVIDGQTTGFTITYGDEILNKFELNLCLLFLIVANFSNIQCSAFINT